MAQNKDPIMRTLLLSDKYYRCSLPAVSTLLVVIAGTLREFDKPNEDCPATKWMLPQIQP